MIFCSGVISSYLSGLNRSPTRTRLLGSGAWFDGLEDVWALAISTSSVPRHPKSEDASWSSLADYICPMLCRMTATC